MTPADWLLDETRRWVRRAEAGLRAAALCIAELPSEALFRCQQAAEKYLKAYLAWNQTAFRKTHEPRELGSRCVELEPALREALEPACGLSKYAWTLRYPGSPYEPEVGEAAAGRALAEQVRATVKLRLPPAATE